MDTMAAFPGSMVFKPCPGASLGHLPSFPTVHHVAPGLPALYIGLPWEVSLKKGFSATMQCEVGLSCYLRAYVEAPKLKPEHLFVQILLNRGQTSPGTICYFQPI